MADGNTPETETRGGDRIDWGKTEPGKPLKQRPGLKDEVPDEPPAREPG